MLCWIETGDHHRECDMQAISAWALVRLSGTPLGQNKHGRVW